MSGKEHNKIRFEITQNLSFAIKSPKDERQSWNVPFMRERLVLSHNAAAEIACLLDEEREFDSSLWNDVVAILKEAGFTIRDAHEKDSELPSEVPIEAETDGLYVASDAVCEEYDNALGSMCMNVNAFLLNEGCEMLSDEQYQCLLDPERVEEAEDMIDDLQARCGLPAHLADPILDVLPIRPIRRPVQS